MTDIVPATQDAPGAAWAQRRDEPAEAYAWFRQWLPLNPRPSPAQCNASELAAQYDWIGRAQAYDTALDLLILCPGGGLTDLWRVQALLWQQTATVEAIKMHRQSMSSKAPVLDPQTQLAWSRQVVEVAEALQRMGDRESTHDLSRLSPERLALLTSILEEAERK